LEISETTLNAYRLFVHEQTAQGEVKRRYVAETLEEFIKLFMMEGTMGIWGTKDSR
jgi:hypothetical protein